MLQIVDGPFKIADTFCDGMDQRIQHQHLTEFYYEHAECLGEYADLVFRSPAFYDDKWDAKTARGNSKKTLDAVRNRIQTVADNLWTIDHSEDPAADVMRACYLSTLSMEQALAVKESMSALPNAGSASLTAEEDAVVGNKTIRFSGTRRQMELLIKSAQAIGLEVEELEDNMPNSFIIRENPDFDSFVAFDIETSGTLGAANGDAPSEIIEIGAVAVENGVITRKFDMLCNPGRKITPMNERITHITNAMVADQPPVSEVIRKFHEFAGDAVLVGHNILSSDMKYITKAAARVGLSFENDCFDSYRYARQFKDQMGWQDVKLETLSEIFGIEQSEAHRAWCDAEANAKLFFELKRLQK